jgi:aldose 1-epimerase
VKTSALALLATLPLWACTKQTAGGPDIVKDRPDVVIIPQGEFDAQPVAIYKLKNASGMEAEISNWGGAVVALRVPDRNGRFDDVVRGYQHFSDYQRDPGSYGTLIGRFANRINNASFVLNGQRYQLAANNGTNSIHGGERGFNRVPWNAQPVYLPEARGVRLKRKSPHGEEGYPGNLEVEVQYLLTDANELRIEYRATTDRPTVVNLTNHTYFNLAGQVDADILGHVMTINADAFTPVNEILIPTGELRPVEGTPFDFRSPTAIGARIEDSDQQLVFGKGYDHNWVLATSRRSKPELACRVWEPNSGRVLELWTTEPGMQFYSGNFMNGSMVGKGGLVYKRRSAFVLETQHFPDSPNQPAFPSTVLQPGETYLQTTVYRFSTDRPKPSRHASRI